MLAVYLFFFPAVVRIAFVSLNFRSVPHTRADSHNVNRNVSCQTIYSTSTANAVQIGDDDDEDDDDNVDLSVIVTLSTNKQYHCVADFDEIECRVLPKKKINNSNKGIQRAAK